jgi:hypothetical protein
MSLRGIIGKTPGRNKATGRRAPAGGHATSNLIKPSGLSEKQYTSFVKSTYV